MRIVTRRSGRYEATPHRAWIALSRDASPLQLLPSIQPCAFEQEAAQPLPTKGYASLLSRQSQHDRTLPEMNGTLEDQAGPRRLGTPPAVWCGLFVPLLRDV
jgi:hypothetical protein